MFGDILENSSSQELADLVLYNSIITLLQQVKLTYGGEGLNSTLKRHKKIYMFLQKYQKRLIVDLESKISDNLSCIMSD